MTKTWTAAQITEAKIGALRANAITSVRAITADAGLMWVASPQEVRFNETTGRPEVRVAGIWFPLNDAGIDTWAAEEGLPWDGRIVGAPDGTRAAADDTQELPAVDAPEPLAELAALRGKITALEVQRDQAALALEHANARAGQLADQLALYKAVTRTQSDMLRDAVSDSRPVASPAVETRYLVQRVGTPDAEKRAADALQAAFADGWRVAHESFGGPDGLLHYVRLERLAQAARPLPHNTIIVGAQALTIQAAR